jgi:dethiobiotin synthetase
MRAILILGTGTDVGKTYAAEQICNLLKGHTADPVQALKPIETGVCSGARTDSDRLAFASRPPFLPTHAYAFEQPISPHLAARTAGAVIETGEVVKWVHRISGKSTATEQENIATWLIVETAGGVFSPISESKTNLDLAIALEPSCWILVATDGLGVLHNVRSTLLAMCSLARAPDILLLNAPSVKDNSTGTNREELERLGWARAIASVRRDGGFSDEDGRALLEKLFRHFEPMPINSIL